MSPYNNFHYLERRLTLHFLSNEPDEGKDLRRKFVYQYLQGDGTFMLRLITSNVSDYVCRKIVLELYTVFHRSLKKHTIGREPLFKSISIDRSDEDMVGEEKTKHTDHDNDDDGSTGQTVATDIPPVPNPRQTKTTTGQDISMKLSTDQPENEPNEAQQTDSTSTPISSPNSQKRPRSSVIPLLKDIRRAPEIHMDSSAATTPRYKNVEFLLEPDTIVLSALPSPSVPTHPPPPPPPLSIMKGPSPYATTYLTTKRRNEHELPYIDDSISSGSTSARVISTASVQESGRPKAKLTSAAAFFRRSHDV